MRQYVNPPMVSNSPWGRTAVASPLFFLGLAFVVAGVAAMVDYERAKQQRAIMEDFNRQIVDPMAETMVNVIAQLMVVLIIVGEIAATGEGVGSLLGELTDVAEFFWQVGGIIWEYFAGPPT